jgi:hypothetical protein
MNKDKTGQDAGCWSQASRFALLIGAGRFQISGYKFCVCQIHGLILKGWQVEFY